MAITKSAKKALRQNARKRLGNIFYKDRIKSLIKQARALVAQKKNDEAKKILPQIYKVLDKAAKENVVKKNNASRRKSRIAALINRTGASNQKV
jgi:small subunit ribosomal protein S20